MSSARSGLSGERFQATAARLGFAPAIIEKTSGSSKEGAENGLPGHGPGHVGKR